MKQCHACGQKLPLKVGDVVEGQHPGGTPFQGIYLGANAIDAKWGKVVCFNTGKTALRPIAALTRLHGYYRITEREPLA